MTAIDVGTGSITGAVGATGSVTVTYTPSTATNKNSSFLSADPSVASVDSETGDYKLNGVGETDIYIISEDGEFEAVKHVVVSAV